MLKDIEGHLAECDSRFQRVAMHACTHRHPLEAVQPTMFASGFPAFLARLHGELCQGLV
ncbi:MAG: hypothetical protein OXC07_05720 [Kistimonas sp.]|nr:hypothetical protein [Kistimonas sp.]